MTDIPIWERLPSDTDKSFEAFCIYRDMGAQRSLAKTTVEFYGKNTANLRYVEAWSSKHNWVERAAAYDAHVRDLLRQQNEAMRVQIEADALADYNAIRKAINKRIKLLEEIGFQASVSDLHDLIGLMEHANRYARLNSGLPDRITENNNNQSGNLTVTHDIPTLPDSILDKIQIYDSDGNE